MQKTFLVSFWPRNVIEILSANRPLIKSQGKERKAYANFHHIFQTFFLFIFAPSLVFLPLDLLFWFDSSLYFSWKLRIYCMCVCAWKRAERGRKVRLWSIAEIDSKEHTRPPGIQRVRAAAFLNFNVNVSFTD